MNKYITISEFGEVRTHKGEIPPEVVAAADDGIYTILDITDPNAPMIYLDEGWTDIDEHSTGD